MINELNDQPLPYAAAIIKLLQGPVYADEPKYWPDIALHKLPLIAFFNQLGIELVVMEQEGLAFIRQRKGEPDEPVSQLPRLVRKRGLTYEQTLLCVMLREWIEEFDAKTTVGSRLFITKKEIRERVDIFFKDQTNRSRLYKQLDTSIEQAVNSLGILKKNREDDTDEENNQYEVRRIIKAMINNELLEEIKEKLNQHTSANDAG